MTLGPGTLVGPYRLERLLGRGGMAVVYEATHESVGRTVALKLVSPDLIDPGFVERFRNEGRMQAALDHPHVVRIYEAGTSEHGPYLAMRLVRGTTLAALIDDGALDSSRALDLVGQVAEALDAAHDAGLVHRDVKPRNVLVEPSDHAYLADFGLTRRGDETAATATGQLMATIAYAAPEVVSGQPAGPAADRYALAAVLFECLTGSTVFPRPTTTAVLYAHTSEPPPRVSGRREGIPPQLDEVLIAGLAKDPAARPARATDLVDRARAALRGAVLDPPLPRSMHMADDTTTGGETAPTPIPPAAPARPGRWALAVAVAAGLLVGVAGGLLLSGGDEDATSAAERLPPAPAGTQRLGSDLQEAGRTLDCRGNPVTPAAPNCAVLQDRLPGDVALVATRNGLVRRWGVRSASGELAVSVLRRDGDEYFQVGRSQTEFVTDPGAHFFDTELKIEKGDRLALVVVRGSGIGVRDAEGATTRRFEPAVAGLGAEPVESTDGELLLRVDYAPGEQVTAPELLTGAAAASAAKGEILARERLRFGDGTPVELRLVGLGERGVLDMFVAGRRTTRIGVPSLAPPVGSVAVLQVYVDPAAGRRMGINVVFNLRDSQRVYQRYFDVSGKRILFIN